MLFEIIGYFKIMFQFLLHCIVLSPDLIICTSAVQVQKYHVELVKTSSFVCAYIVILVTDLED